MCHTGVIIGYSIYGLKCMLHSVLKVLEVEQPGPVWWFLTTLDVRGPDNRCCSRSAYRRGTWSRFLKRISIYLHTSYVFMIWDLPIHISIQIYINIYKYVYICTAREREREREREKERGRERERERKRERDRERERERDRVREGEREIVFMVVRQLDALKFKTWDGHSGCAHLRLLYSSQIAVSWK